MTLATMRSPGPVLALALLAALSPPTPSVPADAAQAPAATPLVEEAHRSGSVDLRPELRRWGLVERRQGRRNTCSVFTVAGAIEFALARQRGQTPRLSVEFLNWASNKVNSDTADGGFFSDLWKGFAAYGICAETNMPYAAAFDPAVQPSTNALAEAGTRRSLGLRLHWIKEWDVQTGLTEPQLTEIRGTLGSGWPVCGGFRWPNEAKWVEGVLQMCASNAVYDGHSVLLVGYRDDTAQPGGGVFLFRNTAGEGRDGAMPYAYARVFMNDAAWINYAAAAGLSPAHPALPPREW